MDSEAKIRTRVLFEENGSLTSLGLELHRHGVLDAFGYRTVGKLTDLTDPLYYFAKNIVFTYENYFQELRDIQVRIDFIRSFAIISLLLFLSSIIRLVSAWVSKDNTGDLDGEGKIMIENDKVVYAMLCCSIAFLLLWWASIQGYEYEEEQFNERVYGYFSTLVASGKESIPIIANMTPPSISGLTTLKEASKEHRFAVVDSKDSFTSRIFRIDRDQMSIYFEPLIVDWGKYSVPTDLEGICSAGSSIWVLESSRWRNNIPRLMELRQDQQPMWNVGRVVELPNIKNIEGLECNRAKDEELWFLFGERGEGNENTELIRYRLNDKGGVAYLQNSPRYTIESPLKAPFHRVRHISDLEIINNTLVISSARDGGDSGPFESVIFSVACINDDMSIQGEISTTVWLETTEMKIEGVTEGWEPRTLLVGADNEQLDGTLRSFTVGNLGPQCGDI